MPPPKGVWGVGSIMRYGRRVGHELTDRFEQQHPDLSEKFRRLRSAVKTDTVPELLALLDELIGLRKFHTDVGDAEGEEGLERLREVARSLGRSEQALTLGAFVHHLARSIRDDADGPEMSAPENASTTRALYIRLMTVHAAKGLEFPVVIIPEVHAPVRDRGASRFLADERDGLDVRVWPLKETNPTESPEFWTRSNLNKAAAVFEEMRIFYVAVTRAQNHVIMVGADTARRNNPTDKNYSWQDEVLAAGVELRARGCAIPN